MLGLMIVLLTGGVAAFLAIQGSLLDMQRQIGDHRAEIREQISGLRAEFKEGIADLRTDLSSRMARLEAIMEVHFGAAARPAGAAGESGPPEQPIELHP